MVNAPNAIKDIIFSTVETEGEEEEEEDEKEDDYERRRGSRKLSSHTRPEKYSRR